MKLHPEILNIYDFNLVFDAVRTLLKLNSRLMRLYKQLRKSWRKEQLKGTERSCFIVISEVEDLWLLGKSYKSLKHTETDYSRDRLFSLYRTVAPDAVHWCVCDMQCHWRAYTVPDSNYLWSIDGYLKLALYGIEIYAEIDAYSYHIIWIYVRITAHTEISVLIQYLNTVEMLGVQSQVVWSDQEEETVLLTEAHYRLWWLYDSDVLLKNIYIYDSSVFNQQIENWWRQMSKEQLFKWWVSCEILI